MSEGELRSPLEQRARSIDSSKNGGAAGGRMRNGIPENWKIGREAFDKFADSCGSWAVMGARDS